MWPAGSFNSIPQKKYGKPINVYVLAYRARLPYPSWAQLVRATLCWNAKTKYHPFMSMFVACTDRYTVTRREKREKKIRKKRAKDNTDKGIDDLFVWNNVLKKSQVS